MSIIERGTAPPAHYSGVSPTVNVYYCTGRVEAPELTPPIETIIGWSPTGVSAARRRLICYSPTAPGVSPLNSTTAAFPPMLTVGGAVVVERPPVGSPDAGWLDTGPRPLAKTML